MVTLCTTTHKYVVGLPSDMSRRRKAYICVCMCMNGVLFLPKFMEFLLGENLLFVDVIIHKT